MKGQINYEVIKVPGNNKKFNELLDALMDSKLISSYTDSGYIIVARHQVNKKTLKKLLKLELAS